MTDPAVPEQRTVDLAATRDRLARLRAEIRRSPLGRYRAGQDAAQTLLDLRHAERVTVVIQALVDDDEDAAVEALAQLHLTEVTALHTAGTNLARLCAEAITRRTT